MSEKYAPKVNVACPTDGTLFRTFTANTTTLNPLEESFIKSRSEKVLDAWKDWIDGSEVGYNMSSFQDKFPTVAMSLSGGGGRAALYNAAVLNAFDARNETSKKFGTGGLYNVAQYMISSSGGSWLAASIAFNNESATIPEIVSQWLFDLDLVNPASTPSEGASFIKRVIGAVAAKRATGITTTLVDAWAQLLSSRFLGDTTRQNFFDDSLDHGAGKLWSDINSQKGYQDASIPFMIAISCARSGTEAAVTTSDVVYEMTPLEFGSFDPDLTSMINMTFAGTVLNEGKPLNSSSCVTGFDQASFVIGSSSDVFDADSIFATVLKVIDTVAPPLKGLDDNGELQALWPNSFKGIEPGHFLDSNSDYIRADDGGENHDNDPIEPVMVKARNVDVVVVSDATSERENGQQNNFPNGTSLIFAAQRLQTKLFENHQQMPPLPADFVETGVNLRPTFFGCDPPTNPPDFPLVIYVPNSPPCTGDDPVTNTPTSKTQYSQLHQQKFLDQGALSAQCGFLPNATGPDPNFPICLKCAAIDRSRLFSDPVIPRSSECQKCFDQYCFNPQNPPSFKELPGRKFAFVDPDPESFLHKHKVLIIVLACVLGTLLLLSWCLIACCCIRRHRRRRGLFGKI